MLSTGKHGIQITTPFGTGVLDSADVSRVSLLQLPVQIVAQR
jgi:hypothetical protein